MHDRGPEGRLRVDRRGQVTPQHLVEGLDGGSTRPRGGRRFGQAVQGEGLDDGVRGGLQRGAVARVGEQKALGQVAVGAVTDRRLQVLVADASGGVVAAEHAVGEVVLVAPGGSSGGQSLGVGQPLQPRHGVGRDVAGERPGRSDRVGRELDERLRPGDVGSAGQSRLADDHLAEPTARDPGERTGLQREPGRQPREPPTSELAVDDQAGHCHEGHHCDQGGGGAGAQGGRSGKRGTKGSRPCHDGEEEGAEAHDDTGRGERPSPNGHARVGKNPRQSQAGHDGGESERDESGEPLVRLRPQCEQSRGHDGGDERHHENRRTQGTPGRGGPARATRLLDRRAGAEEQRRLVEGVPDEVEQGGSRDADPDLHAEVAHLRCRRRREAALGVGTRGAEQSSDDGRRCTEQHERDQGGPRGGEQRPGQHADDAHAVHQPGMKKGGHRGGRLGRLRQPAVEGHECRPSSRTEDDQHRADVRPGPGSGVHGGCQVDPVERRQRRSGSQDAGGDEAIPQQQPPAHLPRRGVGRRTRGVADEARQGQAGDDPAERQERQARCRHRPRQPSDHDDLQHRVSLEP